MADNGAASSVRWIVLVLGMAAPGVRAQLLVPAQYPTIQAAIDAASPGDTVLVGPGTYLERIDFLGKDVVLQSSDGPEVTILDGDTGLGSGSVVTFANGETQAAVLSGFTVRGGHQGGPAGDGGGVLCLGASPSLLGNIIRDNVAERGGAICCLSASPRIEGNALLANWSAVDDGGGGGTIWCEDSAALILHNTIEGNASLFHGSPGIQLEGSPDVLIAGNTIRDNGSMSGSGGAIACRSGSSATIRANRIEGNYAAGPGGGIAVFGCDPVIDSNLVLENATDQSGFEAGGGIFCSASAAQIVANTIRANHVASGGGAGLALVDFTGSVVGNVLAGHAAITGAALFYSYSGPCDTSFLFAHDTVVGNTGLGPAIDTFGGCHLEIVDSIFWDDAPFGLGPGHTVTASVVEGGYPGDALDEDPLLVDAAGGDDHLRFDSPCRDAGASYVGLPAWDFEGDPRVADGFPDMGADEFHRHLYLLGEPAPTAEVVVGVVGEPDAPVALWIGLDLLDPPLVLAAHGTWQLAFPVLGPFGLGALPASGSIALPVTLDALPVALRAQATVGPWLTNVLTVDTTSVP
ncbi:MAG: right-handed parallel beta-helix repeat-containing protein [Planctomycetes bacterium]|nr:right-handed parallel beta-helix repeat-containing protein [Planctomycetota bacterium]